MIAQTGNAWQLKDLGTAESACGGHGIRCLFRQVTALENLPLEEVHCQD